MSNISEDTRDAIFKDLYNCEVHYIDTLEDDEIKKKQFKYSFEEKMKPSLMNRPTEVYIPISKMLDLWLRNRYLHLKNISDTKKIHEAIQRHLNLWKNKIDSSFTRTPNAPYDDLINLDRFAEMIFQWAKHYYKPQELLTEFSLTMGDFKNTNIDFIGMPSLSQSNMVRQNTNITPDDIKREGFSKYFAEHKFAGFRG